MTANLARYGGPYTWTWADAATRNAQTVAAADVGARGFQTDIQLEYELTAQTAGVGTWAQGTPKGCAAERSMVSVNAAAGFTVMGLQPVTTFGTITGYTFAGATKSLRMPRSAARSAASAGSIGVIRGSGSSCASSAGGFWWRFRFVLEEVSANMRWFVGLYYTGLATNVDPVNLIDLIGIGRSATDANVQLFNNDAAGTADKTNLGANFPAVTAGKGYQLTLYTAAGTSYGWQVRNIDSGDEVSGTLTAPAGGLPTVGQLLLHAYASNNTDASNVGISVSEFRCWQPA